jgi:hypothetical protein
MNGRPVEMGLSAVTCALASPVRRGSVREIARTVLPIDRAIWNNNT